MGRKDLISADRAGGTGWRKYSLMDLIWLWIVMELRKLGIPLLIIKKVKDQLDGTGHDIPLVFPLLKYFTALYYLTKEPGYLLVFDNAEVLLINHTDRGIVIKKGLIPSHFCINLYVLIQQAFKEKDLKPTLADNSIKLTTEELMYTGE